MARKKKGVGGALLGPALVVAGMMALWQNEGRFDFYTAARDATVISSPVESPDEPVAYTDRLRTDIPIEGDYVTRFDGYLVVERQAEIYSWDESTDSDGHKNWSLGWRSSLESNSRNSGLSQQLSSVSLYPDRYELGELTIDPTGIQLVDASVAVPLDALEFTDRARTVGLQREGEYAYLRKGREDQLGDERIRYYAVPSAETASWFGVTTGTTGWAYRDDREVGWIAGFIADYGILHHLVIGERPEALDKIRADLSTKTWLTRAGGTAAIVFGFMMFFSVFASLLYRIPLLGPVIQGGVFLVSLVIGVVLAVSVMIAALVFHNPWTIALPFVLLTAGVVWMVRRSKQAGRNAREQLEQRLAEPARAGADARVSSLSSTPGTASPGAEASPGVSGAAGEGAAAAASPPAGAAANPVIENTFMNLAALALAEGDLHKKEKRLLARWAERNGIAGERMDALIEKARTDPPGAHEATREDLELLALIAMADGALMQTELRRLSKVAERVGVSAGELRQMLIDIENGQMEPA